VHIVAKTDVGLVRKRNEDFYIVSPAHRLVVLCDGMGGHPGGDLASRMAAEEVQRAVTEDGEGPDRPVAVAELAPFAPLIRGVFNADRKLRAYGKKHAQYQGMGTTLAALQEHEGVLCAVHVGDSRVYCLDEGELVQLTQDHSIVATLPEAARASFAGMRNILTRALGVGEELEVDFTVAPAHPDEVYVLCTDGLHNYVTEERIVEVLTTTADREKCLETLIQDANSGGGGDNITLALAWVEAAPKKPGPRVSGAAFVGPSGLRIQLAT
jgi:protein phosphatase